MRVQGSAFFFGDEVQAPTASFDEFFQWLASLDVGTEWPPHRPFVPGYPYRRRFLINIGRDYYCGVVLSERSAEHGHFVRQEGNVITVEARALGANKPVEINFFTLRKDSHKGIYSHYYGSYSFNGFLGDLWREYVRFVEVRKARAVAAREPNESEEVVGRPFSIRGKAKWSPLFNPRDFDALVRELDQLTEVRLTTYEVDGDDDAPASRDISNIHHVYRLKEGVRPTRALLDWLRGKRDKSNRLLRSGRETFSGSVLGVSADGHEKTIGFGATLDDHLDYDYDQIGTFRSTELAQDPCVAAMIAKMRGELMFTPG
jgi:hypothetical protein